MKTTIQGTRAASVWGAARSIGLMPEEGEFDALLKELLRDGYVETYPSPSLAAHGLYRLTDQGIAAAEEG
jgi:DNA-binding PadR family transcriptional regulator